MLFNLCFLFSLPFYVQPWAATSRFSVLRGSSVAELECVLCGVTEETDTTKHSSAGRAPVALVACRVARVCPN